MIKPLSRCMASAFQVAKRTSDALDQNPPQQQRIKRIGMIHPQSSPRPRPHPHPPLLPVLFPQPPQQNRRIRIHNQELLPPHVSIPHPQSLLQQPVAAKSLIIEPPNLFLLMLYIMQHPGCVTLNLKKFLCPFFICPIRPGSL